MPRRLLLLLVVLAVLVGLSAAGLRGPSPELRAKVKDLIAKLEATDAQAQGAAEWDLLRLGPSILPLLPTPPAEGAKGQRLRAVVETLKELEPRTFTLEQDGITLKQALKELARQTGVVVMDRSGRKAKASFALRCKALPFWKALDAIAEASGTRASLSGPAGGLTLEAGQATLPVSYHGAFRTMLNQVTVSRDLETGAHTCVIHLDLAWEPRLTVFLVETGPATVRFAPDAKGKALAANFPTRGPDRILPPGRAYGFRLEPPAPDRSAPAIDTLRGTLVVTGAGKMLTFTFDKLREIGPKGKAVVQTQERVRVRLTEVSRETDPDRFNIEVVIENPQPGPVFRSYQGDSWLTYNSIWLQKRGTNQRLNPTRLVEVTRPDEGPVTLRYGFTQKDNPKVRFGKIGDWVLHYRTPGRMVEVSVPYEFKGVGLP
jgi:hypothetical protein